MTFHLPKAGGMCCAVTKMYPFPDFLSSFALPHLSWIGCAFQKATMRVQKSEKKSCVVTFDLIRLGQKCCIVTFDLVRLGQARLLTVSAAMRQAISFRLGILMRPLRLAMAVPSGNHLYRDVFCHFKKQLFNFLILTAYEEFEFVVGTRR